MRWVAPHAPTWHEQPHHRNPITAWAELCTADPEVLNRAPVRSRREHLVEEANDPPFVLSRVLTKGAYVAPFRDGPELTVRSE
jgi:hypothetical protein